MGDLTRSDGNCEWWWIGEPVGWQCLECDDDENATCNYNQTADVGSRKSQWRRSGWEEFINIFLSIV